MDQRLLQISEKIRDKVFRREDVLYRLRILKKSDLYELSRSIQGKKDSLTRLNTALDYFSFPLSRASEEKLEKHKLNFRMQHKTNNNLAQERKLFREMNLSRERNNASALSIAELRFNVSAYCHHHDNRMKRDMLLEKIKQFEVTRKVPKGLREAVKNQIKAVCDELMEMRKKKKGVEAKIKVADKDLEAINEEIWSFQEHLKGDYQRKEASLFFLRTTDTDNGWVLKCGKLNNNSIHFNTTSAENAQDQIQPNTTGYQCYANQTGSGYPYWTYAFYRASAPNFLDLAFIVTSSPLVVP
ncbi:uncharacterized protein LOC114739602 [Neltuma alba]|uniref:uncharacterized protein LOC114739602 n=1 Tax=Neltuma alba TaxID=207710 RepID=UPI0010A50229|nr:uncharacterized protein LOC114739602 [Prosopis alba]